MKKLKDTKPYIVGSGEKVELAKIPSDFQGSEFSKKKAYKRIEANAVVMAELAKRLYAENRRSFAGARKNLASPLPVDQRFRKTACID